MVKESKLDREAVVLDASVPPQQTIALKVLPNLVVEYVTFYPGGPQVVAFGLGNESLQLG